MKIRSCSAFAFLILVVLIIAGTCCATRVSAQTATPTPTETPTPTPDVVDEVDIDGDIFYIERRIGYGEIAIVIVGLAILLVLIVYTVFRYVTHYLR